MNNHNRRGWWGKTTYVILRKAVAKATATVLLTFLGKILFVPFNQFVFTTTLSLVRQNFVCNFRPILFWEKKILSNLPLISPGTVLVPARKLAP